MLLLCSKDQVEQSARKLRNLLVRQRSRHDWTATCPSLHDTSRANL